MLKADHSPALARRGCQPDIACVVQHVHLCIWKPRASVVDLRHDQAVIDPIPLCQDQHIPAGVFCCHMQVQLDVARLILGETSKPLHREIDPLARHIAIGIEHNERLDMLCVLKPKAPAGDDSSFFNASARECVRRYSEREKRFAVDSMGNDL